MLIGIARFWLCLALGQDPSQIPFEEKRLDAVPDEFELVDTTFSPEGRSAACIVRKEGSERVWWKGQAGEAFEQIRGLALSPDGKHLAYWAVNNWKAFVVAGEKLGPYDIVYGPQYTRSGRLVYWISEGAKTSLIVDGKKRHEFATLDNYKVDRTAEFIAYWGEDKSGAFVGVDDWRMNGRLEHLQFSPDGATWAVCLKKEDGKRLVVSAGTVVGEYDWVSRLGFRPGDRALCFAAMIGKEAKLRMGDKEIGEFESSGPPVFSRDGRTAAYTARKGGVSFVMHGDRRLPGFDKAWDVIISDDGSSVAYLADSGGKTAIYHNGEKTMTVTRWNGLTLSPNGKRLAFAILDEDDRWQLFVDGMKQPGYPEIRFPEFSESGAHVAYPAHDGDRWGMILDGVRLKGPRYEKILQWYFHSDVLIYTGLTDWGIDVNVGKKGAGPFKEVTPLCISSDGQNAAFGARAGRELWWKVLPLK